MAKKKEAEVLDMNETLSKSEAFFNKHKKPILITLAAIIIIIAGLFIYDAYVKAPRVEKANTTLAKGQTYFENEQFEQALNGDGASYNGLLSVISDYSGTDAANLAHLYAGLCYANLGNWEEAVGQLEKFSPASDAMVSPAAIGALGNAYAQIGNIDKAVSNLKKAAEMADSRAEGNINTSLSPTFLVQAAELLESEGKKDEALKIYKAVKAKYVNASVVQSNEIDKYIERASN